MKSAIKLNVVTILVSLSCISCARSNPEDDFEKAADHILQIEPTIAKQLDRDSSVQGVASALKTYAEAWEQFMAAVTATEKANKFDSRRIDQAAKRLFEHNETQRRMLLEVVRNAPMQYPTSPTILQSARSIREITRSVVPGQQHEQP